MGDLRNKARKQERDEAHREWLAKHHPRKADAEPTQCLCGLSCYDVPVMWAIDQGAWPRRLEYFCPTCLPDRFANLVPKRPTLGDDLK